MEKNLKKKRVINDYPFFLDIVSKIQYARLVSYTSPAM